MAKNTKTSLTIINRLSASIVCQDVGITLVRVFFMRIALGYCFVALSVALSCANEPLCCLPLSTLAPLPVLPTNCIFCLCFVYLYAQIKLWCWCRLKFDTGWRTRENFRLSSATTATRKVSGRGRIANERQKEMPRLRRRLVNALKTSFKRCTQLKVALRSSPPARSLSWAHLFCRCSFFFFLCLQRPWVW